MKLKPEDFDWEKYNYSLDWVGNIRSGVEAMDHTNSDKWGVVSYVQNSLNLTRTLKPEPVYQLLTPGMEIREGDEYKPDGDHKWSKAYPHIVGQKVREIGTWRRKLPEGTKLP